MQCSGQEEVSCLRNFSLRPKLLALQPKSYWNRLSGIGAMELVTLDLDQLQAGRCPGFDRYLGLPYGEVLGKQGHELIICFSVDWRRLDPGDPSAVTQLL